MTCDCGMAHVPMEADIEVRDPDDEIVAHRAFVHIERMSSAYIWMSIATLDGRRITVKFFAPRPMGSPRVTMLVQDERETSILGEPAS